MQKGIEPTEEEVKGKKLALTPLTALPEELILFQRVLQLFRGVRTSVFDACQSMRGSRNVWLVGCSCAHRTPCLSTSSSTSLRSRCATFRARTRSSQRWSAEPCLLVVCRSTHCAALACSLPCSSRRRSRSPRQGQTARSGSWCPARTGPSSSTKTARCAAVCPHPHTWPVASLRRACADGVCGHEVGPSGV